MEIDQGNAQDAGGVAPPVGATVSFVDFPNELIGAISSLLHLRLQLMLAITLPSISAAIWSPVELLELEDPSPLVFRAVAQQTILLSTMKRLRVFGNPWLLDAPQLFMNLGRAASLAEIRIAVEYDGWTLFPMLLSVPTQLKKLGLYCSKFDFAAAARDYFGRSDSLELLRLTVLKVGDSVNTSIAMCKFQRRLATFTPNVTTLFLPADTWMDLKGLKFLTHLFITVSSHSCYTRHFPLGPTISSIEHAALCLTKMSPPKVGANVILRGGNSMVYMTYAEYLISSHRATKTYLPDAIKFLVKECHYKLDFGHQPCHKNQTIQTLCSLQNLSYATIEPSLVEFLANLENIPFVFSDKGLPSRSMFVQLYKLIAAHTNLVTQESFEALFGEPWERALKAGHTREDLLSEVDVDSKKTIHFLFSSHESTSILDHWSIEFVRSRPDVFGDIKQLRDHRGRSLLFYAKTCAQVKTLISAGLDLAVTDHRGTTALENAVVNAPSDSVADALIDALDDTNFAKLFTPFVASGARSDKFLTKMKRFVPPERWYDLIKARNDSALVDGAYFPDLHLDISVDADIGRLQAIAWLAPINWDLCYYSCGTSHYEGLPTVHVAVARRPTGEYARRIFAQICNRLGLQEARSWATQRNKQGLTIPDKLGIQMVPYSSLPFV